MLPRDRLRATVAGDAPVAPAIATFGIGLQEWEPERVTARLAAVPSATVRGPAALLVLADYAATTSVFSTMTVEGRLTTLTLRLSELVPAAEPGTEVLATAHAVPVGGDAAVSSMEFTRADGTRLARGTARCATFPPLPGWGRHSAPAGAVTGFADLQAATAPDGLSTSGVAAPAFGNRAGVMHGGVIAAVVADALAAGLDVLAPRLAGAPTDYEVTFLRSLAVDGTRVATRTSPVRIGARFAVARTELTDPAGRLAVVGTASRWRG